MLLEFSLSCQLTGAIILLLWCFKRVSKNAIEMCFPHISALDTDADGNGILKKEKLQENVKTIFLNIWAVICIVIGYITAIFAENDMENLFGKALLTIFLTALFVFVGYKYAAYMSKTWYKEDVKIAPKDLEKLNVLTEITSEKIREMMKN